MTPEEIEQKYDIFFGTGYWEEQYKKHIVMFAKQCVEITITAKDAQIADLEKRLKELSNTINDLMKNE